MAAQIAIRHHAGHRPARIHHARAAEAFCGHRQQHLLHRRGLIHQRQLAARMHQIADANELRAKLAARVIHAEIVFAEALALHQRDGDRIAERQHHRRARRRRANGPGLRHFWQHDGDVRRIHQHGFRAAHEGHQRNREPARIGDDVAQLVRFAGIAQAQHEVIRRNHPEIAVARFRRVHEKRGRARARQRRRDFLADMAGFAHAGNNHPAFQRRDFLDQRDEFPIERTRDRLEPLHLPRDDGAGGSEGIER